MCIVLYYRHTADIYIYIYIYIYIKRLAFGRIVQVEGSIPVFYLSFHSITIGHFLAHLTKMHKNDSKTTTFTSSKLP